MAKAIVDFADGEYYDSDFEINVYNINGLKVLILEDNVDKIEIELTNNQFNKLFEKLKEEKNNDK